jgi:hypothetical protein
MRARAAQGRCFARRCMGDRARAEVNLISARRTRRCRPRSTIRSSCCS